MKDIFETLNAPSVTRRFVRLKDGETAPETLQFYVLPEGYRLETDDELRARMQQEWELNMKIEEFDQALGDLIKVICPPNVSNDDPVAEAAVLDVLEKHCEELRGKIISVSTRTRESSE